MKMYSGFYLVSVKKKKKPKTAQNEIDQNGSKTLNVF